MLEDWQESDGIQINWRPARLVTFVRLVGWVFLGIHLLTMSFSQLCFRFTANGFWSTDGDWLTPWRSWNQRAFCFLFFSVCTLSSFTLRFCCGLWLMTSIWVLTVKCFCLGEWLLFWATLWRPTRIRALSVSSRSGHICSGLWLFLNFEVFRSFLCDLIAPWNFGSVWHMRLRVGVLQLWRCWRSGFISRRLHAAAAEEAEEGTRRQPGMWMGLMGQDWWIGRRGWKMVLSVFWDLNFRVRPKEERCILFKTEFYVVRYPM